MRMFPFSVLSGLRLFSAANRLTYERGIEIDNLLHLRLGGTDFVVLVEAKNQQIELDDTGRWIAKYKTGPKCTRDQVDVHIRTLWEYLEPISRDIDLKFIAIVCSASRQTPTKKAEGYRNSELHLTSVNALPDLLATRFNLPGSGSEVLRVSQSGFLGLLRLGLPVSELGHPELASAIGYVERCRRTIDLSLFQDFRPTRDRWAINGSAGMGKSVLLAYTAAVLASGYELYAWQGQTGVKPADEVFATMGFNPDHKHGSIGIMAMSAKQLDNIRMWYELFVGKFQQNDEEGRVRFRPPEFLACRDKATVAGLARRCRALLVDEAHDLPAFAAREIAEIHIEKGFYLAVACDRHQQLRLAGSNAKIIEGLDFTNKSKRLRQIYRSPAPVYIASLALMFRWFAEDGPKVLPGVTQLRDSFGFEANHDPGTGYDLIIESDAHPANSWCHTVATYPSAKAAFSALTHESVGRREVLWVRFCEEDPDFDYEQVGKNFTYHNCRIEDAHKISDKYVKGQDYPIVVVEGFPSFMDRFTDGTANEDKMWAFRRELYLCASRATCFLYFICNVGDTPEVIRIKEEINRMVAALALPVDPVTGGTMTWRFFVGETKDRRSLDVFADAMAINPEAAIASKLPTPGEEMTAPNPPDATSTNSTLPVTSRPPDTSLTETTAAVPAVANVPFTPPANPPQPRRKVIKLPQQGTVRQLASRLGVGPYSVIGELLKMNVFVKVDEQLALGVAKKICESHECDFEEEFEHNLVIDGPMTVMNFARELGVQHREVMVHATRLGIFVRGGTVLEVDTMRKIAAAYRFGIVVKVATSVL